MHVPGGYRWLFALLVGVVGCRMPLPVFDSHAVTLRLQEHMPDTAQKPPTEPNFDGLSEDAAIVFALHHNAAFQSVLTDLGIAHSDLIQAGLLPNPEFVYFLGSGAKPFKYAFDLPLEALWLRPIRVQNATHEANRTAERLTQAALDLIRDTRQAYADVLLAHERVRVAKASVTLRERVAELAKKRLDAGDISPQELATATIDALQANQDASRIAYEVPLAEERLLHLLGCNAQRPTLHLEGTPPAPYEIEVATLTRTALASRPDLLAAKEATHAASVRVQFARVGWVRFLGIADATSGKSGHEFGPALRFTVPLFNQNEGAISRAEADLAQAQRNEQTIANQIILDVRRAALQYQQASTELTSVQTKVRPEVEAAIKRAQGAYAEGNVAIFVVLETTRQLLDADLRQAQLTTDLRRTWAELERSVGRKLTPPPKPASTFGTQRPPEGTSGFATEREAP